MNARIITYLVAAGITLLFSANSFAQELQLVYDVENTGEDCPEPYLAGFSELSEEANLPNPFEWADGRGELSFYSDWRCRRAEINAEIQHYEVGEKPTKPDSIEASYANGVLKVIVRRNGEALTLTSNINLPENGTGPFPAIIGMGGATGSLPADIFTSRDIAQISFNYGQVMAHTQSRGQEPINKIYPELEYMGAYSAWPWGVSRIIDGLEMVSDDLNIDTEHLGVTGCSFAGKMALFSGALDERIALTIAQESGGGGAPAWRVSETLTEVETLGRTNNAWFIEDMWDFQNAVDKLPHDHHELMAMVAPRALLATGNTDFQWLANPAAYVSAKAVEEVYKALDIEDRFAYYIDGGHGHCAVPASQKPAIEVFVDKFLLGIDTVNTDVSVSPYSTNLDPWITWETPELINGTSFFKQAPLKGPENTIVNVDTSLTLTWNKVDAAAEYLIEISTDPLFKTGVMEFSTADTSVLINDLSVATRYHWRVQVRNGDDVLGPWSRPWNFTTTFPTPQKIELSEVVPFSTRNGLVYFRWNPAEYAQEYTIEISDVFDFSDIHATSTTTDTTRLMTGINEGIQFYWKVRAENFTANGPWSEVGKYMLVLPPSGLLVRRDENDEALLSWTDNSNIEDGFIVEKKREADTDFSVIDSLAADVKSYIDSGEEGIASYRVRAYKDTVSSVYTSEASVVATSKEEQDVVIPATYSLDQNYPNPFNPRTNIGFTIPENSFTKLVVYDLLGREQQVLVSKIMKAGYHTVSFDAAALPSGVYLYKISSGDFNQTKKMLLLK